MHSLILSATWPARRRACGAGRGFRSRRASAAAARAAAGAGSRAAGLAYQHLTPTLSIFNAFSILDHHKMNFIRSRK